MKILFCLIAICATATAAAQKGPLRKTIPKQDYKPLQNIPSWIDTTNMYAGRHGKVARLTQDNMPCTIPYNAAKKMPNAFNKNQPLPDEIPNLWKKDSIKK